MLFRIEWIPDICPVVDALEKSEISDSITDSNVHDEFSKAWIKLKLAAQMKYVQAEIDADDLFIVYICCLFTAYSWKILSQWMQEHLQTKQHKI